MMSYLLRCFNFKSFYMYIELWVFPHVTKHILTSLTDQTQFLLNALLVYFQVLSAIYWPQPGRNGRWRCLSVTHHLSLVEAINALPHFVCGLILQFETKYLLRFYSYIHRVGHTCTWKFIGMLLYRLLFVWFFFYICLYFFICLQGGRRLRSLRGPAGNAGNSMVAMVTIQILAVKLKYMK